MIEHLTQPSPAELDALTALLGGLRAGDARFPQRGGHPLLPADGSQRSASAVDLYVTRDTGDRTDGTDGPGGTDGNRGSTATGPTAKQDATAGANEFGGFTAFAGVAGDMLEMLFVAPGMRGKGFGRQLVNHITRHCGVRRVDVNEQNPQAKGFYEHMGFQVYKRTDLDEQGNPYPLLYMRLGKTSEERR